MDNSVEAISKREGKYLTFALDKEEYGISILKVKEIIGMIPITSVPQMPEFARGVINLRDKVIPVVDLRARFEIQPISYTDRTCIIVLEAQASNMQRCWTVKKCGKQECPAHGNNDHRCWMISGTFCRNEIQGTFHEKIEACRKCDFYQAMVAQKAIFTIGIVVDTVSEVLNIIGDEIEDPPYFGANLDTKYILGIAKKGKNVKILLDIDKILSANEITLIQEVI